MLTLTIGRTAFKICHKEGARTTVWEVESDASEATLVQTFKDVIGFVEGPQEQFIDNGSTRLPTPYRPPVDDATVQANGWAELAKPLTAPPELPEDRQGEWELIKPGEDA